MSDIQLYFKCEDQNSEFFKKTIEFFNHQKEITAKRLALREEFGLPKAEVLANNYTVVGFRTEENIDLPKGLRISQSGKTKGLIVPDRKTKIGRQFAKRMGEFKKYEPREYTRKVFGAAPMIPVRGYSGGGLSMLSGVGASLLSNLNIIIIKTTTEYIKAIKEDKNGHFPEVLIEITGSEVTILQGKN